MTEKNRAPTPKRLRDARRQGDVAFSADLTQAAAFGGVLLFVWLGGASMLEVVDGLWRHATSPAAMAAPGVHLMPLLWHFATALGWTLVPVAGVSLLAALLGGFGQVGGLMAWSRVVPDGTRLDPAAGLQRILSTRNLVALVLMVLKTGLLAALVFFCVRSYLPVIMNLGYLRAGVILSACAHIVALVFLWAALIYVVTAGIDFLHQRFEYMKRLRMSLEEVRREHKDNEGDPVYVARRRAAHHEAVFSSRTDRVMNSSLVIHGAHTAVALAYASLDEPPRVMASGEGGEAVLLRKIAGESGVSLAFMPRLAQLIHDEVPVDQSVPMALAQRVLAQLRRDRQAAQMQQAAFEAEHQDQRTQSRPDGARAAGADVP